MSANHHHSGPEYIKYIIAIIIIGVLFEFYPINKNKIDINLAENRSYEELSIIRNTKYRVSKIYSGDVIAVNNNGRELIIKLLGVGSPQYNHKYLPDECYGKYAYNYLKAEIYNKDIFIELDNNIKIDEGGRMLAYIYNDKSEMINRKILSGGYGREDLYNIKNINYKYAEQFVRLENFAKVNDVGLWNKNNCKDF